MPELPEVETVVRQLRNKILNATITNLKIMEESVIDKNIKNVLPTKIIAIERRGKSIIFKLSNQNNLLIQLRMTGHFYHVTNKDQNYRKFLTGIFKLDNNSFLTYNSIRKFGKIQLLNNEQLKIKLQKLGPEPSEINQEQFVKLIKKYPNANIKNKLLDQNFIAGIGNIYAQEALYYAKINPRKRIKDISNEQLISLHQETNRILQLAIRHNGSTVDNYSNLDGKGDFQNFLTVYNQTNCPEKHIIDKIFLAGRGTSYCPKCQKY